MASTTPNLIIAGVYKCGTTSLFDYLAEHPEVCPSSLKQVSGWVDGEPPFDRYEMYLAHHDGEPYRLEAAPTYFARPDVAAGMKKHFDSPKIVMLLRDPAARMYSNYKYEKSLFNIDEQKTFMEFVKASEEIPDDERDASGGIDEGIYTKHLQPWFEQFGDDVRIIFFEHLKDDPDGVLHELCGWLGIDAEHYRRTGYEFPVKNRSVKPRSMGIHKVVRQAVHAVDRLSFFNPVLYAKARKAIQERYRAVNTKPDTSSLPDEPRRYLEGVYGPHNAALRADLEGRGYAEFPDWLSPRP